MTQGGPHPVTSFSRGTLLALGVATVLVAMLGICGRLLLNPVGYTPSLTTPRRVTYIVRGFGEASLTYQNQSGGTEQRTVKLPWNLELKMRRGEFVYLSAQKQQETGTIEAFVYIDGQLLQTAESDSAYGIASVSGTVPY